jgi:hypothetical protein
MFTGPLPHTVEYHLVTDSCSNEQGVRLALTDSVAALVTANDPTVGVNVPIQEQLSRLVCTGVARNRL